MLADLSPPGTKSKCTIVICISPSTSLVARSRESTHRGAWVIPLTKGERLVLTGRPPDGGIYGVTFDASGRRAADQLGLQADEVLALGERFEVHARGDAHRQGGVVVHVQMTSKRGQADEPQGHPDERDPRRQGQQWRSGRLE